MKKTIGCAAIFLLLNTPLWSQTNKINTSTDLSDSVRTSEKYLYEALVNIIEKADYAPPPVNDTLSKEIFDGFIAKLDPEKDIFLQSDIDSLEKYRLVVDDDINNGNPLNFYVAARSLYLKRIAELKNFPFFKNPVDWNPIKQNKKIVNPDSLSWTGNTVERDERRNLLLTYEYLTKLADLQKGYPSPVERSEKAKSSISKKYNHWLTENTTAFNEKEFFAKYVNILCAICDPHTEYQPPVDKRKFDQMMSNAFYGIGAQLGFNDQMDIVIKSVMSGMAAWKSGKVANGSIILAIGQGTAGSWTDVAGLGLQDVVDKIRGAEGTFVRIRIKDANTGNVHDVLLKREKVNVEQGAARSAVIEQKNGKKIGILYLPEFYNDFNNKNGAKSADDVKKQLTYLTGAHIDALLIDLRNNGGGSLSDAIKIAGYFIPSGPVVQVRDSKGNVSILSDEDSSVLYKGPLAIMVNAQSASASEIFTAAMQDYKRAIVIGTNTYGKGTVQRQLPLGIPVNGEPQYGALKLTFEKFYRINGATTQRIGITPDVFLPDVYNYFPLREKDQPYALKSDSVARADYQLYPAETAAVESRAKKFDYRNDSEMIQINAIAEEAAKPIIQRTDFDFIKQQYKVKTERLNKLDSLETLKGSAVMKVIPLGDYQDKDWYKDWIKKISTSREIFDAKSVLFQE
ncbi:hypothetical protein A9P82_02430 [Arachidicoccus ginsenosidimutans]|uniref:S41 family peptidase n=1 Tax=Arachidicoccus sp. BS20 TaxID=1850526 RepID=UPI0007F15C4D|nr:S41 family peptidase [Arachidicoccus sp. BS20]ANI88258.1 hypothetical protein A9P82_02430 [Arachidicoccus sp. BS20]